jgi:hypothetical protein
LRQPLAAWFAETESGRVAPQRAPWERRGWFAAATTWIEAQVARRGQTVVGPVEQVKGAWYLSAVLRVPTAIGDLYFKAGGALPPSEPEVLAALAAQWPRQVPQLVAVDAARRWMLLHDFGRDLLELDYDRPLAPLVQWERAVHCFAQLQIQAASRVKEWAALGCIDWRGTGLARLFGELARDDAALRCGAPDGLTDAETAHVRRLVPRVRDLCEQLVSAGIPDSLLHLDFSGRNTVFTGGGYLFYDWSDAAVGFPFISGTIIVREVRYPIDEAAIGPSGLLATVAYSAAARQRFVRDAYLEPWTVFAPAARLREAFALAEQLRPVWRAVRARRQLPHLELASPWTQDLARSIPALLRQAIARIGR